MDIKSKLNTNQYLAASSKSQYLRIIAGAGTGKTRTLTYRIAYLITEGINPKRMVAITFTNKAAKEMQTRVDDLLSQEGFSTSAKPLICTFHGFCFRFLRKEIGHLSGYSSSFNIADDADQSQIYKDIFSKMTKGSSKEFTKAVVSKISDLKTKGLFVADVTPTMVPLDAIYTFDELIYVYDAYQKFLRSQNLLDFDDLLMLTLKILRSEPDVRSVWQNKYDIFLVDEFQDTNSVQYELVKLLLSKKAMLTVVGDPDQTIYTWRGAKNEIIKDSLSKDFPSLDTVVLDENYRSTQKILNAANALIRHNSDRLEKNLVAASGQEGENITYISYSDMDNEAYGIASQIRSLVTKGKYNYNDIAILYRSNYLSNAIEKKLTNFKIPYEVYGGMKFYERAEIKDALSYLRLLVNPDDISFRRILKAPSKGVGDVTLTRALSLKALLPEEENSLFTIFKDHTDDIKLSSKSKILLAPFYQAYRQMKDVLESDCEPAELVTAIRNYFVQTGFLDYVNKEDKKMEDELSYTAASSQSKTDNVMEFLRDITSFLETEYLDDDGTRRKATLEDFLIEVALQSDQDTMKEEKKVALMTGHVSKGLEFPVVFVTGLCQNIFPTSHALSSEGRSAIEEERRLLYVCVTRARERLYLSSFGGHSFMTGAPYTPSMFLRELDLATPKKEPSKDYSAYIGSHRPSARGSLFSPQAESILKSAALSRPTSNANSEVYNVGDEVIHTSFGVGKVKELLPGNKILVEFPAPYGEKKLMIGFKAFRKKREGE